MALESKPLFHPEVLRQQVRSFILPEQTGAGQPKLEHWADLIASQFHQPPGSTSRPTARALPPLSELTRPSAIAAAFFLQFAIPD